MNHDLVPQDEVYSRISRLKKQMHEFGADIAILRHGPDLYYFTGTLQDGHLVVPLEGEPVYFVWRSFERAKAESPLSEIVKIKNFSELEKRIKEIFSRYQRGTLWITLYAIPYKTVQFYGERLFPGFEILDCTHFIRTIRAIKSPWEIDKIRGACRIIDKAMEKVREWLRPGVDELALTARLECFLRENGHQGQLPMRNSLVGALPMTQVLTGPHGAIPSFTLTPAGGPGVSPTMGVGAGTRPILEGDPVSVDIGGFFQGYLGDETRIFSLGPLKSPLNDAFEVCITLMERLERELRPGVRAGAIYDIALNHMESTPFLKNFMGYSEKVQFVGHGLGVEIDEYPFISIGNEMTLESGMVVALEPKLVFSGLGIVGIEDTFLITDLGAERLTLFPRGPILIQ